MTAFATVDEVQARLDWTLDAGEKNIAQGALEDLSDWACHYGRPWTADTAPGFIKRLVIRATARWLRNPDGYETSRAGDETVGWNHSAETPGAAEFTEAEIKAIKSFIRPHSFGSMQMSAFDTKLPAHWDEGLVPSADGGSQFPLFSTDADPW